MAGEAFFGHSSEDEARGVPADLVPYLEAADAPRTLVLAERADPGWRATLDGAPLSAAAPPDGAWRQAFAVPAGAGGELVIEHRSAPATAMTRVIWIVWALTILWALPLRGRRSVA